MGALLIALTCLVLIGAVYTRQRQVSWLLVAALPLELVAISINAL